MATLPLSGGVPCTCDADPYLCGCNSGAPLYCICLVPRCRQCHGLMPNAVGLLPLHPPLNSSNADRYYPGVPRTTSRVHTQGANWGTATASVAQQASSTTGFSYLPIRHPQATEVRMNTLGANFLPQVPMSGIIRHNNTIMNAEASMLHSSSSNRSLAVQGSSEDSTSHLGPRERQLISSCSEDRYVFTRRNSPAQGPHPRASLSRHGYENQSVDTYTPHLRGGGKGTGGRKAKSKAKKTPWDNANLMTEAKAFLYESGQSRSKLQALLSHPSAEIENPESSLSELSAKRAKHATRIFQDNGLRGFNDPEFIAEAIGASNRRRDGDFEDYEAHTFAEEWMDPDSSEEYDEKDELDNGGPRSTLLGLDGASDEIPQDHGIQLESAKRRQHEDVDMSGLKPSASSFGQQIQGQSLQNRVSANHLNEDVEMSTPRLDAPLVDGAFDEQLTGQIEKITLPAGILEGTMETDTPRPSSSPRNDGFNEKPRDQSRKKRQRVGGFDGANDDDEYEPESEESEDEGGSQTSQSRGSHRSSSMKYHRDEKGGGSGGSTAFGAVNRVFDAGNHSAKGQQSHSDTQKNGPSSQYTKNGDHLHLATMKNSNSRIGKENMMPQDPFISRSSFDTELWKIDPALRFGTNAVTQYQSPYHTPQDFARFGHINQQTLIDVEAKARAASQLTAPRKNLQEYVRSLPPVKSSSTCPHTSPSFSSPYSSALTSLSVDTRYTHPDPSLVAGLSKLTTQHYKVLAPAPASMSQSLDELIQPRSIDAAVELTASTANQNASPREPYWYRYPSPPLGGLNGNFFPDHQPNFASPPTSSVPQECNVDTFSEAALEGVHLDPRLHRDSTDDKISRNLLEVFQQHKSSKESHTKQSHQMATKRVWSNAGDIFDDLDETVAQRAKRRRLREVKPSLR